MLRILLLCGFLTHAGDAWAQGSGTFSPTGKLITARYAHTATLLEDGRVLIAGGCSSRNPSAVCAAEIYDPATETFTATGNPITARANHAAVRLLDGRVLIAGGYIEGGGTGRAELFDPSKGTFEPTGLMVQASANNSAVRLEDGRVLLLGGNLPQPGESVPVLAQIYDPATGTFKSAGWGAPVSPSATLLPGGKVLIVGGWKSAGASVFDPATDRLYAVGPLRTYPFGVYWHTATLLGNGRVLVTGGDNSGDGSNPMANAELYDLATERFVGIGSMSTTRQLHSATLLPGGAVLLADQTSAELYDPASGKFSVVTGTTGFRTGYGPDAVLLHDGRVLFTGAGSDAALYTPPTRALSAAGFTVPLARGSLALLVGSRLATSTATSDTRSPATTLGGISLRIRDSAGQEILAPLLHVSPAQINFQVPPGIATGDVTVDVLNSPSTVAAVTMPVRPVAPGLFALADGSAAASSVRFEPNGSQTVLPPGAITLDARPVHLIVYATGVRNRSSVDNILASIGDTHVPVTYAGPAGDGVPGLDQINIELTAALKGQGHQRLVLTVDGIASNSVAVEVR